MPKHAFYLFLIAASSISSAATPAWGNRSHVAVSLLSSSDQPRPGQTILLGFRMTPDAGWHTYWSNPGESGLPPSVQWRAPRGLQFGGIMHPAPTILKVSGLTSYVHSGEHVLLTRVRVSSALRPGTALPIGARLSWATCSSALCVPQNATFELQLVVGNGAPNSATSVLKLWEGRIPHSLPPGRFEVDHDFLHLKLSLIAPIEAGRARFFPDENEILIASPIRLRVVNGTTEIIARRAGRSVPRRISGVLADERTAYRISFSRSK